MEKRSSDHFKENRHSTFSTSYSTLLNFLVETGGYLFDVFVLGFKPLDKLQQLDASKKLKWTKKYLPQFYFDFICWLYRSSQKKSSHLRSLAHILKYYGTSDSGLELLHNLGCVPSLTTILRSKDKITESLQEKITSFPQNEVVIWVDNFAKQFHHVTSNTERLQAPSFQVQQWTALGARIVCPRVLPDRRPGQMCLTNNFSVPDLKNYLKPLLLSSLPPDLSLFNSIFLQDRTHSSCPGFMNTFLNLDILDFNIGSNQGLTKTHKELDAYKQSSGMTTSSIPSP